MSSGDRSDPTLQMIDNELVPTLTYDGYQDDVKDLEAAFYRGDMRFDFVEMLRLRRNALQDQGETEIARRGSLSRAPTKARQFTFDSHI